MNQQQRKYAKERVSEIFNRKMSDLKSRYTTPGTYISKDKKLALIKQGKVKALSSITKYTYVVDAFDFSGYEKPELINKAALNKAKSKLKQEYNKVLDEIMLGDEETAIKLIERFGK